MNSQTLEDLSNRVLATSVAILFLYGVTAIVLGVIALVIALSPMLEEIAPQ